MSLRYRPARFTLSALVGFAIPASVLSGCADMLPSAQSVAYWTPDTIWYRMQPNQLGRLNEFPEGLTPDAYYSVSDYPERDRAAAVTDQAINDATIVAKAAN
ncbi:MAG TPA: hypothetical protein VFG04_22065 [Planctomycetaceae bacterium]|jgi:hypothetical protein|nr:hypothetical protein [Planctomycetaceae bacterium]